MENTEIWKAKGKAMDTNTFESPCRIPKPVLIVWKLTY